MILLYIFLGGGIGASLRFLLSSFLNKPSFEFPIAILTANIIGSFLIGLLAGKTSPEMQLFLIVGILGGFTTFSTFSLEALQLLQNGKYSYAVIYILASVILSLFMAFLGLLITK